MATGWRILAGKFAKNSQPATALPRNSNQLFLARWRVRRAGLEPRYFCSGFTISDILVFDPLRTTLSNSVGVEMAAIFFPIPLINMGLSCSFRFELNSVSHVWLAESMTGLRRQ